MEAYKNIWFINMFTTQVAGIGIMFLIHIIYKTLSIKNKEILESKILLSESENRKSMLLENLDGMVYKCHYDKNLTMEYVSEGCFELTGYKPENLINNKDISYKELIDSKYRNQVLNDWEKSINSKTDFKGEYLIKTANNEKKWVYEQGKIIYNKSGIITSLEGIIIDITERKNKEDRILYLNQYDVLTDVYNRRWFDENLNHMLSNEAHPISVLVSDINGLKLINDTLGHQEGDRLIKEAANIIKRCCRGKDIIARTGGDEFIVLMPNTTTLNAIEISSKIKKECINLYSNINKQKNILSLSIGYATKNTINDSFDDVLKLAEDYMFRRKLLENKSIHSSILSSITTTMDERSHETKEHSARLASLAEKIGINLNFTQNELDELKLLSMLHDIGKIGIVDSILNKPGKLTESEWLQMKMHPEIGYRIAIQSPELSSIADYILSHHERWDGNGYPKGLKGENIPIHSRIVSIVDAYDAMTHNRPYRKALSKRVAYEEIKNNSGKQFDPKIVNVFLEIIGNEDL